MGKKSRRKTKMPPPKKSFPWLWVVMGSALVLILGGAVFLWQANDTNASFTPVVEGAPRLAVDRTEVDEGDVPLNKMIRSSFTLTNVGDQSLQIMGEPEVELVEGC